MKRLLGPLVNTKYFQAVARWFYLCYNISLALVPAAVGCAESRPGMRIMLVGLGPGTTDFISPRDLQPPLGRGYLKNDMTWGLGISPRGHSSLG